MKYLNSQEYNTIVLAITESTDYVARGKEGRSKEQYTSSSVGAAVSGMLLLLTLLGIIIFKYFES